LCELVDADPTTKPRQLHSIVGNIIKQYLDVFSLYGISCDERWNFVYYGDVSVMFA